MSAQHDDPVKARYNFLAHAQPRCPDAHSHVELILPKPKTKPRGFQKRLNLAITQALFPFREGPGPYPWESWWRAWEIGGQYASTKKQRPLCALEEAPLVDFMADRVLLVADDGFPLFSIARRYWTGINYVRSTWDGNVWGALALANDKLLANGQARFDLELSTHLCVTLDCVGLG